MAPHLTASSDSEENLWKKLSAKNEKMGGDTEVPDSHRGTLLMEASIIACGDSDHRRMTMPMGES